MGVKGWSVFINSIQIKPGQIHIFWKDDDLSPLVLPFTLRRRANEQRLLIPGQADVDPILVGNIAIARKLYAATKEGHLITHAAFKALLFLGAGSVIMAMHHEQDMRKMGGLKAYMPITYWTFLIGTLALVAFPPFALWASFHAASCEASAFV